jgi:hypothetical protein
MFCSLIASAAVFLVLTSPDAEASCGGYLYRQGQPVEHSQAAASPTSILPEGMNHIPDATDRAPDQIPSRRCAGPGCSESPVPLVPISVPITVQRTTDPGLLPHLRALSPSSLDGLVQVQSERIARPEPAEVFRPPAA